MRALTKLEENVLLIILKLRDDAYIVSIKDRLERISDKNLSFGALYISLNRLIKYGYLESSTGGPSSVRGGRAKKYYALTRDGVMALKHSQKLLKIMWKDFDHLAKELLES